MHFLLQLVPSAIGMLAGSACSPEGALTALVTVHPSTRPNVPLVRAKGRASAHARAACCACRACQQVGGSPQPAPQARGAVHTLEQGQACMHACGSPKECGGLNKCRRVSGNARRLIGRREQDCVQGPKEHLAGWCKLKVDEHPQTPTSSPCSPQLL